MKTGYVISVTSLINEWPSAFYLIDDKTCSVVKMFDTMDELNIYADLNNYVIKDLSSALSFKNNNHEKAFTE